MSKTPKSGTIEIDGIELAWEIRHLGGASNMYENYRGISVSVVHTKGATKELIINFHFQDYWWALPPSKQEFEDRLTATIKEAIAAGWAPTRRGKAFIFEVPKRDKTS
ncbi:MAG: hypothetical protein EG822_11185 [Deltaproteobacteria bacterium]|nr:hypothetical protein [Deltaproteobacteria bacterium]